MTAWLIIHILPYVAEPNLTRTETKFGEDLNKRPNNSPNIRPLKSYQMLISEPCLNIKDIGHLLYFFGNYKRLLGNNSKRRCNRITYLIDILFQIELHNGSSIIITSEMEKMIRTNWLKNNQNLFNQFSHPKTLTITNRMTLETTGINPLRAWRPRMNNSADSLKYTLNAINQSIKGCNFSNKHYTIMDNFGRVEVPALGLHSAHNAFQYTDPVGIFIPEKHHNWMEVTFM